RPISALRRTMTVCRPGKRLTAIAAPTGKPTTHEIPTAVRLTRRLNSTMWVSLGSAPATSCNAWAAAWVSELIALGETMPVGYDMYRDAYVSPFGKHDHNGRLGRSQICRIVHKCAWSRRWRGHSRIPPRHSMRGSYRCSVRSAPSL